jgi:hypothetical protein
MCAEKVVEIWEMICQGTKASMHLIFKMVTRDPNDVVFYSSNLRDPLEALSLSYWPVVEEAF